MWHGIVKDLCSRSKLLNTGINVDFLIFNFCMLIVNTHYRDSNYSRYMHWRNLHKSMLILQVKRQIYKVDLPWRLLKHTSSVHNRVQKYIFQSIFDLNNSKALWNPALCYIWVICQEYHCRGFSFAFDFSGCLSKYTSSLVTFLLHCHFTGERFSTPGVWSFRSCHIKQNPLPCEARNLNLNFYWIFLKPWLKFCTIAVEFISEK